MANGYKAQPIGTCQPQDGEFVAGHCGYEELAFAPDLEVGGVFYSV